VMDDALAISSFYVARRCISPEGRPTRGFFLWHIAGLASLAISNVLVVLTASPQSGGVTSQGMASFPMSIVPTWIGPMVLMFHLLALYEGIARRAEARRQGRSPAPRVNISSGL
jgi:hypothetical protein